jgi:hypothetical protein
VYAHPSTTHYESSYNISVEDLSKKVQKALRNMPYPDCSRIKPPTESAAIKMIANLRAAAGTKADHTPKK